MSTDWPARHEVEVLPVSSRSGRPRRPLVEPCADPAPRPLALLAAVVLPGRALATAFPFESQLDLSNIVLRGRPTDPRPRYATGATPDPVT